MATLPNQLNDITEQFGPHPAYSAGVRLATNVEPDKLVKTHCCFCGQQCGIQLKVKDNVLIGFEPETDLLRAAGVRIDPSTLVPEFDPESCESNVPGLYLAGTLQAGRETHRIFIENSRDHGERIVRHLRGRLAAGSAPAPTGAR